MEPNENTTTKSLGLFQNIVFVVQNEGSKGQNDSPKRANDSRESQNSFTFFELLS
jgi:hypothetical protein